MVMDVYSLKIKMKFHLALLICILLQHISSAQAIETRVLRELPEDLEECSGIAAIGPNALVMINDSGNDPVLFISDTLGQIFERVTLLGIPNRDWESLAYQDGLLYIGDFGNNANTRQNLEIFIIDVSKLLSAKTWALKGSIPFSYPEQKNFPPADSAKYYDLEAMVVDGDSIFLFTKNRTKPFDGWVKVYGLSTKAEVQKAKLIKAFKTNVGLPHFNWVSGACLGPNGTDLFLLGYSKLWYMEDWRSTQEQNLFSYRLNDFSQKEAICLIGNRLFIAEENSPKNPQTLHLGDVRLFQDKYKVDLDDDYLIEKTRLSNRDTLQISFRDPKYFIGQDFKLFGQDGTPVFDGVVEAGQILRGRLSIPLLGLAPGKYILSFEGRFKRAFIIRVY